MGMRKFAEIVRAVSPKAGYHDLVYKAEGTYGMDCNNGISACEMADCVWNYPVYSEENRTSDQTEQLVEENAEKWKAKYIDLGVVYRGQCVITPSYPKQKPHFVKRYGLFDSGGGPFDDVFDTEEEAIAAAEQRMKEYKFDSYVRDGDNDIPEELYIAVKPFMEDVNDAACAILKGKFSRQDDPALLQKDRPVCDVHEYLFFGYAAE